MTKDGIIRLAENSDKENKFVDFKSELDTTSALAWCEVAKDLIAMANSGGGILVFGVNDDGTHSRFNSNIILTLDPTLISEKISRYLDVDFTEFEQIEIQRKRKRVASIYVSPASVPYVFSKNGVQFNDGKKFRVVFAEGTIYFRRGANSRPGNTEYIRKSFDAALEQVRKEWFKGVRQISGLGVDEVANIEVKEFKSTPTALRGKIKLSDKGVPVKFTSENVKELNKLFPLPYADVIKECRKKKKIPQRELQNYIESCKQDDELAINWGSIGRNLEIPATIPDRYTYSSKVIERF